jgi:hypothetical protein
MKAWLSRHISRRGVVATLALLALAFGLMQLVPYRVSNPPVRAEPPWDSERTLELARAACFNCHSNETETYWFEDIAPVAWLITRDVESGREELNFSECNPVGGDDDDNSGPGGGDDGGGEDAADEVLDESMPPAQYTLLGLHPEAELSASERRELAEGLLRTLSATSCGDD